MKIYPKQEISFLKLSTSIKLTDQTVWYYKVRFWRVLFTYIPVERSPNWDNVALHDINCLISMNIKEKSDTCKWSDRNKYPLVPASVDHVLHGIAWVIGGIGNDNTTLAHGTPCKNLTFEASWSWRAQQRDFFRPENGPSCNPRGQESAATWTEEKSCCNDWWG